MKLTARTEPCGCWGGHGCRRIIIEGDGRTLQNVCEYVLGLWRATNQSRLGVSEFDTLDGRIAEFLAHNGIIPVYDAPQAWRDALARAEE
jgi:hypothetical protein